MKTSARTPPRPWVRDVGWVSPGRWVHIACPDLAGADDINGAKNTSIILAASLVACGSTFPSTSIVSRG